MVLEQFLYLQETYGFVHLPWVNVLSIYHGKT